MILMLILMTGLMAGIYFAFSVFVMQALTKLPNLQGARAMNSINDVIVKTLFLPLFFSSTLAHLVLIGWAIWFENGIHSLWFWGGFIYVTGMFGVTVFGNVPLNNRLKSSADNAELLVATWQTYTKNWSSLNHIRTATCAISFVLLVYADSL